MEANQDPWTPSPAVAPSTSFVDADPAAAAAETEAQEELRLRQNLKHILAIANTIHKVLGSIKGSNPASIAEATAVVGKSAAAIKRIARSELRGRRSGAAVTAEAAALPDEHFEAGQPSKPSSSPSPSAVAVSSPSLSYAAVASRPKNLPAAFPNLNKESSSSPKSEESSK